MKAMNWISTKERLPEEGKYVLGRHNRGTWIDDEDQENVNCVVVMLVKGISNEERELMKEGKLKTVLYEGIKRHNLYMSEDEYGNNRVPYNWETFGPMSFFGQEITHWMPIIPIKNENSRNKK